MAGSVRIHKANKPILEWDDKHPAKVHLLAQRDFRRAFVGFELSFVPGDPSSPDVAWESAVRPSVRWTLSGLLYAYLSYTTILNDWLADPTGAGGMTEAEQTELRRIAECRELLTECERHARGPAREESLEIITATRQMLDIWERSVLARTAGA
jgi:hypothetical protein